MSNNPDISVLNSIYRGAKTGCQAIEDLLPKTENTRFRSDLKTQENQYRTIGAEAAAKLVALGTEPEPVGPIKKAEMKLSTELNALISSDTSHLAQMMIQGSNMGITTMTRVLNNYVNPNPDIKNLANRLIDVEHQNLERLKAYLQ